MLLEVVYSCKISRSFEGLLIGSSMNGDEFSSCLFETLSKLNELFWTAPSESCLDGNWNGEIFSEDVHDFHGPVTIYHETRPVATFDDFFCRTPHIDINPLSSIGFDDFASREKNFRRVSKDLKYERVFDRIMC